MNPRSLVTSLCALTALAAAGDVTGHAVITKRLTKKAVASPVYNLRGATAPVAPSGGAPVNEFENTVIMMEGGPAAPNAPITATIEQRNSHFDPELLVIPVGSTVQFPNFDPIFHNVFSLSRTEPFDLGFYPLGKSRTVKQRNRSGVLSHSRQHVCRNRRCVHTVVRQTGVRRQLFLQRRSRGPLSRGGLA